MKNLIFWIIQGLLIIYKIFGIIKISWFFVFLPLMVLSIIWIFFVISYCISKALDY